MKRVERRATIGAPPEEVFGFLADLDNIAEWQTGVVSVRRTTPGPIAAGATAQVVRDVMGQRVEAPLTVVEYDPPNRLGIESKVSGVEARAVLDLTEAAGGGATELEFAMEIRGSMLSSFLEPIVANAAAANIDASLERLKSRFASEAH